MISRTFDAPSTYAQARSVLIKMIGAILDLLRPTPREVVNLARREADPRYVADFEPLHLGPVLSLLVLAGIGIQVPETH